MAEHGRAWHTVLYLSGDEFVSKQHLDEVDKMIMEVLLGFFVKAFEMRQSQDENLFRVLVSPHIYVLEHSLITEGEKEDLIGFVQKPLHADGLDQ